MPVSASCLGIDLVFQVTNKLNAQTQRKMDEWMKY